MANDYILAIGDSISAGFISNTTALTVLDPIPIPDPDEDAAKLISINDSFDPSLKSSPRTPLLWFGQMFNHKNSYSWASGEKLSSQYVKFTDYYRKVEPTLTVGVKNFSYSGATTADLKKQASEMVSAWRSGKIRNIQYVTVLIGANDICLDPKKGVIKDVQFSRHLRDFFATISIIHQEQPIRILISSLPKIPDLGNPEIINHVLPSGWTCGHKLYLQDKFCNRLTEWSSNEAYEKDVAIVEHTNELIRSAATEANALYPKFQVFYSGALYTKKIEVSRLAKDCFHPNELGQTEISDLIWNDQPWWH